MDQLQDQHAEKMHAGNEEEDRHGEIPALSYTRISITKRNQNGALGALHASTDRTKNWGHRGGLHSFEEYGTGACNDQP